MCIVQDKAMTGTEAPTMCAVYGSARLALCALDSTYSEGELFSRRELVIGVATAHIPTVNMEWRRVLL